LSGFVGFVMGWSDFGASYVEELVRFCVLMDLFLEMYYERVCECVVFIVVGRDDFLVNLGYLRFVCCCGRVLSWPRAICGREFGLDYVLVHSLC